MMRRKWQPPPVLLPREFLGQMSLVGCYSWGCTESDMTEVTEQQQQTNDNVNQSSGSEKSFEKTYAVGSHFLLQKIFLTNPGLLNCRQVPYQLSHH